MLIALPAIGLAVSACTEESDCSMVGRATMKCMVYSYEKKALHNNKDTLDWITVTALGTDSIIINSQANVFDMYLPLQYTVDSTALVFHYNSENLDIDTDTLIIRHVNTPKFVSMDCGYEMKQSITKSEFTTNRIDSIHISSPSTNTNGTENLKIFF